MREVERVPVSSILTCPSNDEVGTDPGVGDSVSRSVVVLLINPYKQFYFVEG